MHLSPYNGVKDSNTDPIIKYHLVDFEHRGRYTIIIIEHNKHNVIGVGCVSIFSPYKLYRTAHSVNVE